MAEKLQSLIKTYITKLSMKENYILDDIEAYLATCSTGYPISAQYVKHNLDITLVMSMDASKILNASSDYANINYMSIKNAKEFPDSTARIVYYFVIKKEFLAEGAVRFTLHMDVLNTFKMTSDYSVSPLTLVSREHKDRFVKAFDGLAYHWVANIDRFQEGLNPRLFQNPSQKRIYNDNLTEDAPNWYLIYKNSLEDSEDASNVVNCFLATDGNISYTYTPLTPTITPANLEMNKFYYFFPDTFNFDGIDYYDNSHHTYSATMSMIRVSKLNSNQMLMEVFRYPNGYLATAPYDNTAYDLVESYIISSISATAGNKYYVSNIQYDLRNNAYNGSSEREISLTPITRTAKTYDEVNKTDSRLIKIIKIPYPATSGFSITGGVISFDSNEWEFDETEMLLKLNTNFHDYFINNNLDVYLPFDYNGVDISSYLDFGNIDVNRFLKDSKMFNSEFYQIKFVYDSFEKVIPLENMGYSNWMVDSAYETEFIMTRTINSKFMFNFKDIYFEVAYEDYPNTLIVQRNNEEVLYSSPYINYIRSGFNYDVKAKNQQIGMSWFTTGLGVLAGALNVAFGSKTLGVGLIASSVASLGNAVNTTITAERNFEKNLQQLKMQSNSVSGADDVDLMSIYAENKLCQYIYEPSAVMKDLLDDMFYFIGYATNEYKVPSTHTRVWFNFLQCDLRVEKLIHAIPEDCLDEIIQRYKGGVYFMHNPKNNGIPDFSFTHENWEMTIINR